MGRPFPIYSLPVSCCDLLWDVGAQRQLLQKSVRNQGWSRIDMGGICPWSLCIREQRVSQTHLFRVSFYLYSAHEQPPSRSGKTWGRKGKEKTYQMCVEASVLQSLLQGHPQPAKYHLECLCQRVVWVSGLRFMSGLLGAIPDYRREH